jgi:hypothetical protein
VGVAGLAAVVSPADAILDVLEAPAGTLGSGVPGAAEDAPLLGFVLLEAPASFARRFSRIYPYNI